jgi:hypothetical protein
MVIDVLGKALPACRIEIAFGKRCRRFGERSSPLLGGKVASGHPYDPRVLGQATALKLSVKGWDEFSTGQIT